MDKSRFTIKPKEETCDCIICHNKGVVASDEHIIPKSIGGYLHTWNVCKTCNSIFGDHVDKLLVNQHLVQHMRYKHQLKGQSKEEVKHPFASVFDGEDGKQYKIEDEGGVLTPHIIGSKPVLSEDGKQMSLIIDASDSKQINGIVEKFCKRNKLQMPKELPDYKIQKSPAPAIQFHFALDFDELKLAMLKMAYEFTACMIPEYVDYEEGKLIANILKEANSKRVAELEIGANILKDDFFRKIFGEVINFDKKTRHYILLANVEDRLICCVKIFNLFCTTITMAHRPLEQIEEPIIVVNDFGERDFELFKISELLEKNAVTKQGVKILEPYNTQLASFNEPMGFYCDEEHRNYCFDKNGKPIGTDVDLLARFPDNKTDTQQIAGIGFRTIFHTESKIYFLLWMSHILMLVPIEEIILETNYHKY